MERLRAALRRWMPARAPEPGPAPEDPMRSRLAQAVRTPSRHRDAADALWARMRRVERRALPERAVVSWFDMYAEEARAAGTDVRVSFFCADAGEGVRFVAGAAEAAEGAAEVLLKHAVLEEACAYVGASAWGVRGGAVVFGFGAAAAPALRGRRETLRREAPARVVGMRGVVQPLVRALRQLGEESVNTVAAALEPLVEAVGSSVIVFGVWRKAYLRADLPIEGAALSSDLLQPRRGGAVCVEFAPAQRKLVCIFPQIALGAQAPPHPLRLVPSDQQGPLRADESRMPRAAKRGRPRSDSDSDGDPLAKRMRAPPLSLVLPPPAQPPRA